ncbi:MAG: helix-turn-helix transcriptional regulator [Pseudomonadota bacterium]
MATPQLDDLLNISFGLSEAVLQQNKWPDALQNMADLFNGSFATFELIDKKTGQHLQHQDSSDMEIQQEYLGYYMPKNPRIAFGNQADTPRVLHDNLFISERNMKRNEFYVDFLQPYDLRYFLSYKAYDTPDVIGVFTIQRGINSGPADKFELLAMEKLSSTLSNIANLQINHSETLGHLYNLENMFATLSDGVVFLDSTGMIIDMNELAVTMLSGVDGLTISNGKPGCTNPLSHKRLGNLISNIADENAIAAERSLLVPRSSGLPPYKISAQPIANADLPLGRNHACTLLIIQDPASTNAIEIETLMDCFGFTNAEAKVALEIANGQSVQEIAHATATSLATIRTHMQRIMQKMSINRQSEIVRIISKYL